VLHEQRVLAKAGVVERVGEPVGVVVDGISAEGEEGMAHGQGVEIEQDLLGLIRPGGLAAVDRILLALLRARVIEVIAATVGNGRVVFLDAAQDLPVERVLERFHRLHHGRRVRVLRFQVSGDTRIVLVAQPEVIVLAAVAVNDVEPGNLGLRAAGRARWPYGTVSNQREDPLAGGRPRRGHLLLPRLGAAPFDDPGEGMHAEIARELLHSGDPFRLTLNGVVYVDKPPLLYWLEAGAFTTFGRRKPRHVRYRRPLAWRRSPGRRGSAQGSSVSPAAAWRGRAADQRALLRLCEVRASDALFVAALAWGFALALVGLADGRRG